jgi:hypothetical protein
MGILLATTQALAAEPLTDNDKAAMLLAAGQRAWHERNYPFAIDRFKEFLKTYGGHQDAVLARYGLGVALVEGPQKDFPAAVEALQPAAGKQDFPERAFALYYLGLAHRGLGQLELDKALAKPPEAEQRRNNARQKFAQAEPQFAAAVTAFAVRAAAPAPPGSTQDPAADLAWTARSRCSHAEMLLHLGKYAEARKAVEPLLADPAQAKSRDRKLAVYQTGYARFALGEYQAAGKALATLAPFDDPVFGVHARYLLARTHHVSEERPEALALYDAVLAGYEQQKKDAQTALQNPQTFKDTPDEKTRLETLLKNPAPEFVARSAFYRGILLYELNRFAESQATFATFSQKYPDPALAKDPGVRLYKQVLRRYLPDAKVREVANLYGMAAAFTMVDALRHAGAQPTRASLLRAATHLNERNPFLVKGVTVRTGPNDYYPVERTRMLRFHSGRWRQFGGLASVR